MSEITTTDLTKFGRRGRGILIELLTAWQEKGLPEGFYEDEVQPMLNRSSGYVFLTNSDYQVAMMNGDTLGLFYTCYYCGAEGFEEDFEHGWNHDEGACGKCSLLSEEDED